MIDVKNCHHRIRIWLAVCGILCSFGGCAGRTPAEPAAEETAVSGEQNSESDNVPVQERTEAETAEAVYCEGLKAAVCIYTSADSNGTGFVYDGKYVITNAHVLYDADDFTLVDANSSEYKGTVIFTDDTNDIAVIRVDDYQGGSVKFGDSDGVAEGDTLLMIGNPRGGEPFSFCTGKRIIPDEQLLQKIDQENRYIAADANIISGYSGGPVFNMDAELIGISNAAYTGDLSAYEFDHLCLIISINSVRELIEEECAE
ncbi:MAG: trypsin-like peptidase domain-containing protein [Solobacterium sp.]|nr:trypsin-like peptidase domain-containing protein [Solobacterium sp.]